MSHSSINLTILITLEFKNNWARLEDTCGQGSYQSCSPPFSQYQRQWFAQSIHLLNICESNVHNDKKKTPVYHIVFKKNSLCASIWTNIAKLSSWMSQRKYFQKGYRGVSWRSRAEEQMGTQGTLSAAVSLCFPVSIYEVVWLWSNVKI